MNDKLEPGEHLYNVLRGQGSNRTILARPFVDLPEDECEAYAQMEAEFVAPYLARIAELEEDRKRYALYAKNASERETNALAKLDPVTSEFVRVRQDRDNARLDVRSLHATLDEAKVEIIRRGQRIANLEKALRDARDASGTNQ
jgi:hypothetical protein